MKYLPSIGLEIHAELKTKSKMFCSCKNDPDEEKANTNVCPICMGHPGTLPVLNFEAVRSIVKVGIAVGGKIADFTEWDRKQYFYPDIPKGYQISQYAYPLVSGGVLADIGLERIHLEEDTAQSTHDTHEKSLINFNRSGVPLMELVTKPVIHDAKTAVNFARELQLLLRYLGVAEANMEKGEMRVEANISVSPAGRDGTVGKLGTKTEVKNLNSFKVVEKAIEYEIQRQTQLLENGERVIQETRGWDDKAGETYSQRSKESSHDYRYFPDPDIPKMKLSEIDTLSPSTLTKTMPELPWDKRRRLQEDFSLTDKEAEIFVEDYSHRLSDYFDGVITSLSKKNAKNIRLATNYFLTDYLGLIKKENLYPAENINTIKTEHFAELIDMISGDKVNSRGAKEILGLLFKEKNAKSPQELAMEHGIMQKNDAEELKRIIEKVISANEKVVNEYRSGKVASIQFLIGQIMKETRGSANPITVKELLIASLK